MEKEIRIFHKASFIIGLVFLLISLYLVFFVNGSHFYTMFTLGFWLCLDFIRYKLTKTSILNYFFNNHHRDAFGVFFMIATTFCLIIDFLYGVVISKMWEWRDYSWINYIEMYIFMNASFIMGVYELYKLIEHFIAKIIPQKKSKKSEKTRNHSKSFYLAISITGVIFLFLPFYTIIFNTNNYIEYVMFFPFIGMVLICWGSMRLLKGSTIIDKILKADLSVWISLLITWVLAILLTEGLNLIGKEWIYTKMPFQQLTLWGIPIAVFVGWLPLIIGAILSVELVQRLDYIKDRELR